ncbi:aryl-sulfate sulfotransferase [Flavobacterium sp.]|uniref:aryl-sulfate sulfotransferase n=1 Tax=Flavobacterium sp. TaxID=239 RepID=UPI0035296697
MKKFNYNPFILFILIILALTSSCSKDDEFTNSTLHSIEVSTGTIYPEFNPEIKDYYITSLNTINEIQVKLNGFESYKTIYINNIKATNYITNIKLNIGEDIIIKYNSFDDEEIKYTIHYLPEEMPKINVITKNNPSEGFTLINMFELAQNGTKNYSYISILNNDGFPVYYKKLPYKAVINFKYFLTPDNQKRFSYNVNELGKTIIMNERFEEINQLQILPHNGHNSLPLDNHDFIYLNDNHFIIPGILVRENVNMTAYGGSSSVDLTEIVIQEILNDQVVFEWNSADYPELLGATDPIYYSQYATSEKVDYFHFNSIAIDPNDQNFVISARHTNQIYKIDRTNGNIIWRFGGNNDDFNLTSNQIISHPHHATILDNGHLLLFDNGVTKNPQESRIVEYELNETNLTANLVYEYKENGRYSDIMGSAQKLNNGNYFIGWGGNITSQINANKSDITEIDTNGNIVLDISFSNNPDSFTYSYRALKYNISF